MTLDECRVKVLCIDDQAVFRDAMRQVIAATQASCRWERPPPALPR